MIAVRWGIVGCGDVTEIKSGPGFQRARGSELVAVMSRNRARADDYARRHAVPRAYARVADLIADRAVDVVYIATPPSSHLEIALAVAAAGKPCLVEKPMAMSHAQCVRMVDAFRTRGVPLWVAYYRRALPRFLDIREQLAAGAIGKLTSVHVQVTDTLATDETLANWRFDPAIAGAGLFLDLASHCFDLLDFLVGPIADARGFPINSGRAYPAEDVVATAFVFENGVAGTGIFNFNADAKTDLMTFTGTAGALTTPVFTDVPPRNPAHVHQPLIQTIVDELGGRGRCESTGESAARASWVMDRCLGRVS